jgi:2-polyprenyl-3-methyl-5-hydroxy-6-metoxy-1,4-benzoquinol methylase
MIGPVADQGSEGLLSPYLRRLRLAAARDFLRGRVLDIGCGTGALAELVDSPAYVGFDIDHECVAIARRRSPGHRFEFCLPPESERFDTVVSLAVIEHVADPAQFLTMAARYLDDGAHARIVITTPHPALEWLHDLGAAVGLFSRHAHEEHEALLDRARLAECAERARLRLERYERFAFGANQLAVFARA